MLCCVAFFFEDTATTEIYTYLHTLSLPDALPIFKQAAALVAVEEAQVHAPMQRDRQADGQGGGAVDHWLELAGQQRVQGRLGEHDGRVVAVAGGAARVGPVQRRVERHPAQALGQRSGEHTSAHQSLMRSSYAGLC